MAWCRSGDKPLSEPMMVNLMTHICVTRHHWVKTRFSAFWEKSKPESHSYENFSKLRFGFRLFPVALKFDRHLGSSAAEMRQISERYEHYKFQSRGFETSRDLTVPLSEYRPRCALYTYKQADIILSILASPITSNSPVCSMMCLGLYQRRCQSKALPVPGEGNPPVTGEFHSQRASHVGIVWTMLWRHHEMRTFVRTLDTFQSPCQSPHGRWPIL